MGLNVDAVVFDLDGVLIRSDEAIHACFDEQLRWTGLPGLTPTERNAVLGPPLPTSVEQVLRARAGVTTAEAVTAFVEGFRARYRTVSLESTTLQPGVEALLGRLNGWRPLGIATSKPLALALPILERLGIQSAFDVVVGAPLGSTAETKGATLVRALAALRVETTGLRTEHVWMVGDRREDVAGAREAGTCVVGALWGYGDEAELASADALADTPAALADLLGV